MQDARQDWPAIKEIFTTARGLRDPNAQAAYVLEACGRDGALRSRVEELLAADRNAVGFLEAQAVPLAARWSAPIVPGQRLGSYEIISKIGSGGMGDVYRARDHRLDRVVAVKVLPATLSGTGATAQRFEREARAIAALNHPNICTVHDVGQTDGIAFIILEYLDGETLASRLLAGALKPRQALDMARQIASALDAVHRAGLVHRDIKPSNIIVTKAGAKLLDFGLSGTLPAGAIAGTVQYMAPEQLDGRAADARSDIFAFGAVLYEMLTGKKAFSGTSDSLAAAIRGEEPAASPLIPASVDRVVRACLAKDPDDRWQSARDLLRELQWCDFDLQTDRAAVRSQRRSWLMAALAAVALAAAALISYGTLRPASTTVPSARFEIATSMTSDPTSFALSPDGRRLAFVGAANGSQRVWIRPLDDTSAAAIDGTDGASFPFWSPRGDAIGFFADGKLKRVNLGGGAAEILADAANGRGATWSRDDVIIFAPTTAGALRRISATGGPETAATTLAEGENSHRWPQFLPDGRRFIFLSAQGSGSSGGTYVASIDRPGATRLLADNDTPAAFASPDTLLFTKAGALMAIRFDPSSNVLRGEARLVAKPVGYDTQLMRGAFAVSDTGVLAYRAAIASPRQLAWVDRSGTIREIVGAVDHDGVAAPELTRDMRTVAVFRSVEGNGDVWAVRVDDGAMDRITFDPGLDGFPLWTPDGRHILFTTFRSGEYGLRERGEDGTERPVFTHQILRIPLSFSSDGKFLLYAIQVPQTGVDVWAVPYPVKSDSEAFPVAQSAFDEMAAQFSPDGNWIAYQANASGRMEIYVRRFQSPAAPKQVSSNGGSQPRWSPDGREIYYIANDAQMMSVRVQSGGTSGIDAAAPVPLFATHLATGVNIPPAVGSRAQYVVGQDGRFLMNMSPDGATAPPIVVSFGGL